MLSYRFVTILAVQYAIGITKEKRVLKNMAMRAVLVKERRFAPALQTRLARRETAPLSPRCIPPPARSVPPVDPDQRGRACPLWNPCPTVRRLDTRSGHSRPNTLDQRAELPERFRTWRRSAFPLESQAFPAPKRGNATAALRGSLSLNFHKNTL